MSGRGERVRPTQRALRAFAVAGGAAVAALGAGVGAISACSTAGPTGTTIYTGAGNLGPTATTPIVGDGGASARSFVTPTRKSGAGAVYVTISGESNAITGYPFPPGDWATDTYMYDGWQFVIQEYIVNIDKITLWATPNASPTDQSQHGAAVAQLNGPFVVDLHKGGSVVGQGGSPEQATLALGAITGQNLEGKRLLRPNFHDDVRVRVQHGGGFVLRVQRQPHAGRARRLQRHGRERLQRPLRRYGDVDGLSIAARLYAYERPAAARRGTRGDSRGPRLDLRRRRL